MSDAVLLERVRQGDERAFEALVLRYRPVLTRYVLRVSRYSIDADDVLQAVFFRLWMGRERLAVTVSMRAYLYAAVRHQTLNALRDARANAQVDALMDEGDGVSVNDVSGRGDAVLRMVATSELVPDTALELADLEATVHAAIDALPPRCREIFVLSREGELSYPEIAAALGISINTVKTQMSRALAALAAAAAPFLVVLLAAH